MLIGTKRSLLIRRGIEYFVDATGGNDNNPGTSSSTSWQTIGKVNGYTFEDGDEILFKRGETWTGTCLTVPRGSLTFAAYGAGANPIIDGNDLVNCVVATAKNNLAFHDIEVTQGLDFGFGFTTCANVYVTDCDAHDCGNDNLIFIIGCHDCRVTGGEFYDAYQRVGGPIITGIEIADGCHDITLDGVTCYGSANHGISIHAHNLKTLPWNITIKNSAFNTNTQFGINVLALTGSLVPASPSIVIDNCTIDANTLSGINFSQTGVAAYPSYVTLDSCEFTNTPAGVYTASLHGANHTIQRNLFEGDNRAVILTDFSDSVFYNNTLHVPNDAGFLPVLYLLASDNSGTVIKNNIMATGHTGTLCINVADGAETDLTLDYNLYYTPSGVAGNRWNWTVNNSTWANWLINSSQDGNSPVPADPLFVNPGADDFTLQTGSPAIDAGVDVGLAYLGTAPDCGYAEKE